MLTIHWKSNSTGVTGHGFPMVTALALSWLDKLNAEFPNLTHWVE